MGGVLTDREPAVRVRCAAPPGTGGTVVDDILAHAVTSPDTPAIVTAERVLSYAELAAWIDRLALALVDRGVGREQVCAIAVDRGPGVVVAMAAVLRAGAAFLTLDVEQPSRRLAAMVHSGRARCLVTTQAVADRLDLPVDGPTVFVGEPGDAVFPPGLSLPTMSPPVVGPRSLAYVSHTSGSTGTPNAVEVEHRGLANYLRFVVGDYRLDRDTVVLQLAPFGYDASIRDTFAPLMAGGRVVLVARSTLLRPEEFAAAVREYDANTVLSITPTFLTRLCEREPPALRLVVSSGESLRPFLLAGGRDRVRGRLVNQYGPTETTMTSTRFAVPPSPDLAADLVGGPIDGVTVHLLDRDLRAVRDGAVGQVWIGGVGVCRGYRGQAALTASRLVPDPFGAPGARMYGTGDLARRTADGNLAYLGRADRQTKIRGYRVDPAEIEGALLAHPAVTGAVVTAAVDDRGRTYLTAYVTGELADVPNAALRAHVGTSLPHYMLPRRIVRIDHLPTTTSGKTDRRALSTHHR